MAAESRFLIDLRLGPRTLGVAAAMVVTVAACCLGTLPLLLVPFDFAQGGHLPYPAAILQVFGLAKHGRRRNARGRPKLPRLKPPPGLLVGVVNKMADARGRVFRVRRHALFGRLKPFDSAQGRPRDGPPAGPGHRREHVARRAAERHVPRVRRPAGPADPGREPPPHAPAVVAVAVAGRVQLVSAARPAAGAWTVLGYVTRPVHGDELGRQVWAEQQQKLLTLAVPPRGGQKVLQTS